MQTIHNVTTRENDSHSKYLSVCETDLKHIEDVTPEQPTNTMWLLQSEERTNIAIIADINNISSIEQAVNGFYTLDNANTTHAKPCYYTFHWAASEAHMFEVIGLNNGEEVTYMVVLTELQIFK